MNLLGKILNNLKKPEKALRNEQGAIGLIAVVLLIIGIIVGVYLVQTRTNLLPKAFDSTSGPVVNYPFGKAAQLNNPNPFVATNAAYLTKTNANLVMGAPFTIEGWVKTPKPTSGSGIKDYNIFSYGVPFFSVFHLNLEVQDSNGNARPSFRFRPVEGGGLNGEICCGVTESSGMSFTPDTWHHIAVTMISEPGSAGGANLCKTKLYMDGVLAGSAEQYVPNCNIAFSNNQTLIFGAPRPGVGGIGAVYYPGELDEFRISKTLRYKENFTPSKLPFINNDDLTQGLWHFDDNTQDAKGFNNLQVSGNVTYPESTIVPPGVVTTPGPTASPAPVQKTASLKLGSNMTGNIGQQFSMPVIFSSPVDPVNVVSAQLNYPADKLEVVEISVDTTSFNNTFEKYYGNGQVSIILGNTTGVKTSDPNAGTVIAKVVFKTKTAGVSEITFNKQTSKMLRVGDNANIYNPDNSNSATITVTTAPTPAPTPIGTPGPSVAFRVVPYCRTDGNLVNRIEHKWVQGSWANTIYRNPPYPTYGESIDVGWARDGFSDPYEDGNSIQFNTTYTYRLGTGDGVIHGPVTVTTPAKCDGNLPPGGKITDLSSCTVIRGYACDKTDLSKPTQVNFYADGLADNGGISIGSTIANLPPFSNFNPITDFGFSGACGTGGFFDPVKPVFFEFPVPNSIKDGKIHKIYAHAVNNPAGYNKPLNGPVTSDMLGTGNNLKCAPVPTPPPTATPVPTPPAPPSPTPVATPTITPCQLTKAEWVLTSNPAQSNTTAGLRVEATGDCTNQQVTFSVREDDGVMGTDRVIINPQPSILIANPQQNNFVATTSWITEFQEDGFFGANNPPEYQFTALVSTAPALIVSGNPLLQVLRSSGTPSPIEGDINNDKTVDLGDISWLLTNWGPIKGNELIDYNNDGIINNFDISAEVAILKQKGVLRSQ